MNPYVARFTLAYLVLTVLVGAVAGALTLKSGAQTGFAVAVTLASSFFAAALFAKDQARAPTAKEKHAFAWRATLAVWLVSLVYAAVMLLIFLPMAEIVPFLRPLLSGITLILVIGMAAFISVINYLVIRWAFGWYATLAVKQGR